MERDKTVVFTDDVQIVPRQVELTAREGKQLMTPVQRFGRKGAELNSLTEGRASKRSL